VTRLRPSIRLRLTASYAGIFLALGVVLLAVSYAVVRHEFGSGKQRVHVRVDESTTLRPQGEPRRLIVRIAPGIPGETAAQVRRLSAAERAAYRRAVQSYRAAATAADDRSLRRVLVLFAGLLAVVTLTSVAAGWVLAGRALRPISRITATARGMSERTLHERIALDGPRDELRELADTFDTMLSRLEGAFDSQRRFVANASHELRTPLAIVRTELDVTLSDPGAGERELRAMANVVRETNDRMERLIASLLALARGEGGIEHPRPADLAPAARAALQRAAAGGPYGPAFAPEGPLRLDAVLRGAPVLGDPMLLERLAENLVENAVRYNAAVGWVRVRTDVEGAAAVLVVENPGPAVPPHEAPLLVEPFRRLEASRARATGGYGLGLAVVRAVAGAHGGAVTVTARPEGGLEVRVSVPAAAGARGPALTEVLDPA
jgi:signal transduction histidine kinase